MPSLWVGGGEGCTHMYTGGPIREWDLYNGFNGISDMIRSMTYFSNFFPFAFIFSLSVGAASNTFLLSGKPYRQIECRSSILWKVSQHNCFRENLGIRTFNPKKVVISRYMDRQIYLSCDHNNYHVTRNEYIISSCFI